MLRSINNLSDIQYIAEDQDYELTVIANINQQKSLWGFVDSGLIGPDPKREYDRLNSSINEVIQFCKANSLPYEVFESEEYSTVSNTYSSYSSGGIKGRTKTVKKRIVFTVTGQVSRALMKDKRDKEIKAIETAYISKSGDWYDRFRNSEAVRMIASETISCINKCLEEYRNVSEHSSCAINFECYDKDILIRKKSDDNYYAIEFNSLGYENLQSEQQKAAVIASVIPYLEKAYLSPPEHCYLYDLGFIAAYMRTGYGICLEFSSRTERPNKNLKAW